ncbi:hypothetical protein RB653_010038 [Dictyostelium firmibasis]|uniref:B box-type domain-containing protein n=1 Tax=Dictyostelium firmibasis TaxID=79012 RepID=A0AAN7TYN3_9MYCE
MVDSGICGSNCNINNCVCGISRNRISSSNKECSKHPKDIILICEDCIEPICEICCSSEIHSSHSLKCINSKNIFTIISKFPESKTILKESLKSIDNTLTKSENEFLESYQELGKFYEDFVKSFNQIKAMISYIENKPKEAIQFQFDICIKTYETNKSKLENYKILISNFLNIYDNIQDIQPENYITFLKHWMEIKKLLSNLNEPLPNYNKVSHSIVPDSIESIKKSLYNVFKIKIENQQDFKLLEKSSEIINNNHNGIISKPIKDENSYNNQNKQKKFKSFKKILFDGYEFTIYENGSFVPVTESIAIGIGQYFPLIFPPSCKILLLPNGFNQSLESLPSSIETLYILKIKYKLEKGSIPNSIKFIHFCEGFDQKLVKGIVPQDAIAVSLHNIQFKPSDDFISDQTLLYTTKSMSHFLNRKSEIIDSV